MLRKVVRKIIKRRRLILLILVILIILFLVFRKKDYTVEYNVDGFLVNETFYKDSKNYLFTFTKDDFTYSVIINDSKRSKKLVKSINEYNHDNETCIVIDSKLEIYPICESDDKQISYHLVSDEMKNNFSYETVTEVNDTYESITINSYLSHTYYIWNYKGFYVLNENRKETINLFSGDVYDPKLIYQVDNFLFIPDYSSTYYFNKVYILNMETGKYVTWTLDSTIYFDSVILGSIDGYLYLVDKHESKEWKINLKKQTIELVGTESKGGITYQNGFIDVSMNKLLNQDMTFSGVSMITYTIDDGLYKIYDNYKELIKKTEPTTIVYSDDDVVYYLVDDTLYCYTLAYGEVKVMSYFEWNFNYNNVIFVW